MVQLDVIEIINIDKDRAPKCPDYDDECVDVVSPSNCWTGNGKIPPAEGYCPRMLGAE